MLHIKLLITKTGKGYRSSKSTFVREIAVDYREMSGLYLTTAYYPAPLIFNAILE